MGTSRFQRCLKGIRSNDGSSSSSSSSSPPPIVKEPDQSSTKLYANNTPRIFLELLSARSTTLVFLATYAAFILGFAIDSSSVYRGFSTGAYPISGFTQTENVWTGVVTDVRNVISFRLFVVQKQLGRSFIDDVKLQYDAEVWACYRPGGCGTNFGSFKSSLSSWMKVLTMKGVTSLIPVSSLLDDDGLVWELIPITFQNQESIPSGGKVASYYMKLNYTLNPMGLFYSSNLTTASTIAYTADILQHQSTKFTNGIGSVILLFFALTALFLFVYIMYSQKKKWLSEQKWVCSYLTALILFINPVYCVIIWIDNASPGAVFAFFVIDAMGQATFFFSSLLFADSINRKRHSALVFYGPKVLISMAIFALYVAQSVLQLPSINPIGSEMNQRSPVEAVYNWSRELQHSYVAISIALLLLVGVWTIYWIATLISTSRKLRVLPYMNTRYLQLSFRFFFMQANLLAAYFVFQYGVVIYGLLVREKERKFESANELTDFINTLFRQQTQLFGKVVFLAVYAFIITFLYLPASLVDSDLATTLASTFVINEREKKYAERLRSEAIARVRLLSAGVVSHLVQAKKEVFCIDAALKFCNISYEAYYDVPGLKTVSGYDTKPAELEAFGYELVDTIYRPEHETFCIIARHVKLDRIVVCFRGTSCKKHWADNLNYAKKELFFADLAELDADDGLGLSSVQPLRGPRGDVLPSLDVDVDCEAGRAGDTATYAARLTDDPVACEEAGDSGLLSAGASPRPSTPRRSSAGSGGSHTHRYLSLAPVLPHDHDASTVSRSGSRSPRENVLLARRRISGTAVGLDTTDDDDDSDVDGDDDDEDEKRENESRTAAEGYRARSRTVESTLERGMAQLADATTNIVEGATGLVVGVAAATPGLKKIMNPHVHSGFWEAYSCVRDDLHRILRRELRRSSAHLFFAGHSLGGAIATIAALDVSVNTVPRVNTYYDRLAKSGGTATLGEQRPTAGGEHADGSLVSSIRQFLQRSPMPPSAVPPRTRVPAANSSPVPDHIPAPIDIDSTGRSRHVSFDDSSIFSSPPDAQVTQAPTQSPLGPKCVADEDRPQWPRQRLVMTPIHEEGEADHDDGSLQGQGQGQGQSPRMRRALKAVKVSMYSFGAPRVGNSSFAQLYDKLIPDSFRTVIDGDVVTSVPPTGYRHVGTEALVDNLGAGSIIVDPSFIERRLRTNTKSSVSVHSLLVYRKGLQGVKEAAEYMKLQASNQSTSSKKMDAVRLALSATNRKRRLAQAAIPQSPPATVASNLAASVGSVGSVALAPSSTDESKVSRIHEAGAVALGDILLLELPPTHLDRSPAPATDQRDKHSVMSRLSITPNGTARDRDYEDAYHYAKDIEQTEFLVSNIAAGTQGTGVNPIDALIRMMTKEPALLLPQAQTKIPPPPHTQDQTRTMTTADFVTADEDDAQLHTSLS